MKIHGMIHQTATGTAENTQYNVSNSDRRWYSWKYTRQSVKQPLSLLQLKINSTICHTVTVAGTAENTPYNPSHSDHHWCSWKYIHLYSSEKKLQLNDNKTQILLIGSAPGIDLPSSLHVCLSDIPLSNAARVIFDNQLVVGCFHRIGLKGFLIWMGLQPHSILHSLCWFAHQILTL